MLRPSKISQCIAQERDHVYAYALELTLDEELANDITQDVMLHALEQADTINLELLLPQLKRWARELVRDQKADGDQTVRLSSVHNQRINDLSEADCGLSYDMVLDDLVAVLKPATPLLLVNLLWLRFNGYNHHEISKMLKASDSVCISPKRVRYLCVEADKKLRQHLTTQVSL